MKCTTSSISFRKHSKMKGQYQIVSELILFGIGIMVTGYVITNFDNVKQTISGVTLQDQMDGLMDSVSVAILKLYSVENGTIRMAIPPQLSGKQYKIAIKDADGGKIVIYT